MTALSEETEAGTERLTSEGHKLCAQLLGAVACIVWDLLEGARVQGRVVGCSLFVRADSWELGPLDYCFRVRSGRWPSGAATLEDWRPLLIDLAQKLEAKVKP